MAFIPNKSPYIAPSGGEPKLEGIGFTRLARLVAVLGVLLSIVAILYGLADLSNGLTFVGISGVIGSLIIGVLTDISLSIAKNRSNSTSPLTRPYGTAPTDPEERQKWANREPPYDE